MNYGNMKAITIPEGDVLKIEVNGTELWKKQNAYVNQVPISKNTDGTVFNGTGYLEGKRLSSSGVLKDFPQSVVTGFIPARGGDVIRIAGVNWAYNNSANYVCAYDSAFTHIGACTAQNTVYGTKIFESITKNGERATVKLLPLENIAYIRVSSAGDNTVQSGNNMIVTINEEIPE